MKPIAPIVALLAGLPLLTSLGCAFIEGLLPQPGIDVLHFLLSVATLLLGGISHFWQKRNNPKSSLLTWLAGLLLILILGSQAVAGIGFLFRPALFAWSRPELNRIAQLYKNDRLPIRLGEKLRASEPDHGTASLPNSLPYFPKHAYVQGEKGHHQLTLVVGGYYMTGFYTYIWCEDGKPPTQALRYGIDSSDHVTPRGDGWFEAVVNNGH